PGGMPPGGFSVPPGLPAGGGEGGAAGFGAPGASNRSNQLGMRLGDTMRHRMNRSIDKIHVKEPKTAEVNLDPTNSKGVIIKALTTGVTQIELTDDAGTKETYTLRVR